MQVAIIDDRPEDRTQLHSELDSVLREKGYTVDRIDLFQGGEEFIEQFQGGSYDLLFFDIYMEGMNGIEAAAKVRKVDNNVRIIFVTTSNDFAAESYSLRADYYLLKPYNHADIIKAIELIDLADYEKQRVVTLPDSSVCLFYDILYSEYDNHRVVLYMLDGKKKKLRTSQSKMEASLCSNDSFVTCTKGVIVNLAHVVKISDGTIYLEAGRQVPVSRRRMPEIRKAHADYLFRQVRH